MHRQTAAVRAGCVCRDIPRMILRLTENLLSVCCFDLSIIQRDFGTAPVHENRFATQKYA